MNAYFCDKMSAFGGVVGVNRAVNRDMVEAISRVKLFVECIAAPDFEPEALELLQKKENLRVMKVPLDALPDVEVRSVMGGLLVMQADRGDPPDAQWEVVSERHPTEGEWHSMRFGWKACRPILSNAVVLVQGTVTVGIGGGQPNRVDCVKMAVQRAGEGAKGSVLASDSFFPQRDSIDEAAKGGVTAIVFQGGSKKDNEVIAAANEHGIAMVKTGVRHFRH
jgi:phosphoribosylaminoimidazolecarboxamide formyltransferase/IMP cyclohydrolase